MNVIKEINNTKLRASQQWKKPIVEKTFLNCEIRKISRESWLDNELVGYLTRTQKGKYTKIHYLVKFCDSDTCSLCSFKGS